MDEVQQYKCGYCGFLLNSQCQNLLEHECMIDLYEEGIHDLVVDNNHILTIALKSTGAKVCKEVEMFGTHWEETFIQLVQERPALYNIKLPLMQRTNAKKNELWKEISSIFGDKISIVDLQKKWKYLRDCFIRAKKKVNEYRPSGSEAISKQDSGFRHYTLMKFLDDGISEQGTVCSVEARNTPSTSGVSSECTTPLTSPSETMSLRMSPTPTLKRKRDAKKSEGKKDLEEQILQTLSSTSAPMDGIDGFLMRLGESLRKLPYRERAKLEITIMQLVYETENKLNID